MSALSLTPKNWLLAGVLVVLAVGAAIVGARSCSQRGKVDVQKMTFLFKCTNPQCGEVFEWTGAKVFEERKRKVDADAQGGSQGNPSIIMPCPKCRGALAPAQRTAAGEVQAVGSGLDPRAEFYQSLPPPPPPPVK